MKTKLLSFKLLLLVALSFFSSKAYGQISIPSSTPVIENFNSMNTNGTAALPSNWKMSSAGTGASAEWNTSTNVTAVTFSNSSGTPNSGGRYNFGDGNTNTDRAIGFMTSGSYASPNAILSYYRNHTGSTIKDLTISFDFERYRINTNTVSVAFYTSKDGVSWTSVASGDISTLAFPTGPNAYTWTNQTKVTRTATLTNININNLGSFYLK